MLTAVCALFVLSYAGRLVHDRYVATADFACYDKEHLPLASGVPFNSEAMIVKYLAKKTHERAYIEQATLWEAAAVKCHITTQLAMTGYLAAADAASDRKLASRIAGKMKAAQQGDMTSDEEFSTRAWNVTYGTRTLRFDNTEGFLLATALMLCLRTFLERPQCALNGRCAGRGAGLLSRAPPSLWRRFGDGAGCRTLLTRCPG